MVQLWIEVDQEVDVLRMILTGDQRLRRMALFDAVLNNADRKGGHILPDRDGHIYGCDHGVCFSAEPKLRTVLWGWRGRRLSTDEVGPWSVGDVSRRSWATSCASSLAPVSRGDRAPGRAASARGHVPAAGSRPSRDPLAAVLGVIPGHVVDEDCHRREASQRGVGTAVVVVVEEEPEGR